MLGEMFIFRPQYIREAVATQEQPRPRNGLWCHERGWLPDPPGTSI